MSMPTTTPTTSLSDAIKLTNPGWLFKRIMELYVDRKLVLLMLMMMHLVMTFVVYGKIIF
jgi:hypothetical protein